MKGSAARQNGPLISEEIGKDAIKGYLICNLNYSIYTTRVRTKTSPDTLGIRFLVYAHAVSTEHNRQIFITFLSRLV